MGNNKAYKVVYVEDSPQDIAAMKRAIAATDYVVDLSVFSNLKEAEDYVNKLTLDGEERAAVKPDLLFLDQRLHGRSSMTLLSTLKSNLHLMTIPTIVLSGSGPDVGDECCSYGAAAYVKKPFNPSELKEVVSSALNFWLAVAHQPRQWIGDYGKSGRSCTGSTDR